jgi:hypothetical protein
MFYSTLEDVNHGQGLNYAPTKDAEVLVPMTYECDIFKNTFSRVKMRLLG